MSRETQESSDRNHPVLAKMMRSLKSQKVESASNIDRKSEDFFVSKKSFAASNNNLFGRQTQLQKLQQLFDSQLSQSSNQNASSLALVHGRSGSGKSSLVDAFLKTLPLNTILFAAKKFDQLKSHSPYATLIKAANDLARKALQSPDAKNIKNRLLDELGPDIRLLAIIVEELSTLLKSDTETDSAIALTGKALTRFKLLLRSFIRSIASQDTPVVLFFDDLQWADEATMEMLKALLTDKLSNHILLILAYRDDEMDTETLEKYFSITALNDDESQQQQSSSFLSNNVVHRTEIEVPDLDLHALNQMVSAVLKHPENSTTSLSTIIMKKTQGNPFYALNFMDMLNANGMLQETNENKWEWDESVILQQTDVSENLAKILETKILRLPEKVRSILQLAAFIGHDFASNVLTTIVHEEQDMIEGEYSFDLFDKEVIQQWIVDALNLALEEGLVELSAIDERKGTYKFSHDKIQHCLYKDLMPDDVERRLLHQRIGKLIWNTISSQDHGTVDDWILFLATDNLNRGPKFVDDDGDRVEMIELNLRAGKLAASKAAFLVGVEYLRSGEKLITDDAFVENNYELCMDLWRMELTVGALGRSNELTKKIHKYARETEHHFPAYLTEIKVLSVQSGMTKNAMELGFDVLKKIGVKFPKKITPFTVVKEFIRTKFMIGSRTPEELMKLPRMTDKEKVFAMELLSSISVFAFIAGESAKFTFVAVFLRMATLTLKHGLSDVYAPQAFVGYGVVCCLFGKIELGLSFGDAAQRLLKQFDTGVVEARAQFQYLSFICPWREGLNGMESFLQVYHKGMVMGDIDYAFAASIGWILCGAYGAAPLSEIVKKGTKFCLEMEEYGQKSILLMLIPTLQLVRNLLGDSSNQNPAILTGRDIINLEEFRVVIEETKSNRAICSLMLSEVATAALFGDWERVQLKIPMLEQVSTALEGHFTYPWALTLNAWINYTLFDMTRNKWHRRVGRRHHRQLKQYAKQKNPLAIIACEALAIAKATFVKKMPVEECEDLFVSALQDLEEAKHYRTYSLVADGLAELFLKAQNIEKGVKYLQESMQCSIRWGAEERVRYLESRLHEIQNIKGGRGGDNLLTTE